MPEPRMILNFEAVVNYTGHNLYDESTYEIQLMVNHHVIYRWPITAGEEYLIRDRGCGRLESVVAKKLFELLNPATVKVRDITPEEYRNATGS